MINLQTDFKPKCLRQGIKITDDDLRLIERALWKVPPEAHKSILRDYMFEWVLGMRDAVTVSHKQHKGRLRANSWLENIG